MTPFSKFFSFTTGSHGKNCNRSIHFIYFPFLELDGGPFTETATKAATRRANTKSKDGEHLTCLYMCIYLCTPLFFPADGKAKRSPSAYNLFVKEHMKAYLADNPGKTNKDAMKHVRLAARSSFYHSLTYLDWCTLERCTRESQARSGSQGEGPKSPQAAKESRSRWLQGHRRPSGRAW